MSEVETEVKTEVEKGTGVEPETAPKIDPKCTCNDEYAVLVCPVHHGEVSTVEEDTLAITDDQLVSNEMGTWKGYIFMCPSCSKPGIMANPALGKRCACCGKKILIKSKIVTEVIRKIESQKI